MEGNVAWTGEAETRKNIELVNRTRIKLQPYITGSYVNVPDLNLIDYGQEYYGINFACLEEIKAKYDPENVFNFIQSIPPALLATITGLKLDL